MADILETSSNWLETMRQTHRTKTVTYRRGASSVSVAATVGRSTFEATGEDSSLVTFETRDYLITTADLVLDGQQTAPQVGDRIEESDGTTVFSYDVIEPNGQPCWRWSDAFRKTRRIFTALMEKS